MGRNLLVSGDKDRIISFIRYLAYIDCPINLFIIGKALDDYLSFFDTKMICNHFSVTTTDNLQDYRCMNGMIFLYAFPSDELNESEIPIFLSEPVDKFRTVVNNAINMYFTGQIIINGYHDEILAYFANKFSGKDNKQIISTGTLPQTILLKHFLHRTFNINLSDISISILGNETHNVISWSRAYIGQLPILNYLSRYTSINSSDFFSKTSTQINNFRLIHDEVVQFKAVLKVIDSIYLGHSSLVNVGHVANDKTEMQVLSNPVILNQQGIVTDFQIILSDSEQQILQFAQSNTDKIINKIIENNKK
jgi:hypothetical protein